jgi:hypothetical protein
MGDRLLANKKVLPDSALTAPGASATTGPAVASSSVVVTVICICSANHLRRCLEALRAQRDAPDFDVIVAHDPQISGIDAVGQAFPEVRIVSNQGQRSPLELASRALKESKADLILLTEDHCIPSSNWVRAMVGAQHRARAVVGGRVETLPGASATDWAFYFVDFFRYAGPVAEGPSPTLTVCNVAYKRSELESVRDLWATFFLEPVVNDALRERFGLLWLHPDSEVTMARHVRFRDAIHERYAFGRLLGAARVVRCTPGRRLYYAVFAPALPPLLLGRMANVALRSRRLARLFLRSLGPLTLMVLAWSWGEWLGYLTGTLPRSLTVAPEIPRGGST